VAATQTSATTTLMPIGACETSAATDPATPSEPIARTTGGVGIGVTRLRISA